MDEIAEVRSGKVEAVTSVPVLGLCNSVAALGRGVAQDRQLINMRQVILQRPCP